MIVTCFQRHPNSPCVKASGMLITASWIIALHACFIYPCTNNSHIDTWQMRSRRGQNVVKMWLDVVAGLWDLAQILGFGAQAAAGPAYHQSQSTEQVGTQGLFWATCDGHGHGSHAIHRNDELLVPRWPHAGWCYCNCRNTLFIFDPVMIPKRNHHRAYG